MNPFEKFRAFLFIGITFSILLSSTGCEEVTYPKETLRESVIKLCREEYDVDIDASTVGNTLAIYLSFVDFFGATLNFNEKAQEKIWDVVWGATRVVLSTDADIKFYCIIIQDVNIPQIQIVIIKYVEDVKRAMLRDISRGEYLKRTLRDLNENPQARKEQGIIDVLISWN